jgi:uncharacterized protein (TIGR00251 family)
MLKELLIDKAKSGTLKVEIKPNAGRNEVLGWVSENGAFRVSVKAQPKEGRANTELVKFLSRLLGKKVRIVSGHTSKRKVLKVL